MSREHLKCFLPLPTGHIVGKMHMSSKCTQHVITSFQAPSPPVEVCCQRCAGLLRGQALTPSKKGCPASHVPGVSVPRRLFPPGFSGTGHPSGRLPPTPDAPRPAPGPTLRVRWLCNLHQLHERCQPTGFTGCTALKPIS